jgi:hypothetical protein
MHARFNSRHDKSSSEFKLTVVYFSNSSCEDSKCSNRDASDSKEIIDEGIKLLEGAFSETEAQDAKSKKHLADIGNNAVSTVIYLAGVGANWCIHLQNCNQ